MRGDCPHESGEALHRDPDLLERSCVAHAHKPRSARAERRTGHACDTLLLQKAQAEILVFDAGFRDVGKHIESTLGQNCLEPHPVERSHEKVAAALVLRPHSRDIAVAVVHGFDARRLAERRRAHDAVLVNLHHRADKRRRPAGVAETEARHGPALGKSVQQNQIVLALDSGESQTFSDQPSGSNQLQRDL